MTIVDDVTLNTQGTSSSPIITLAVKNHAGAELPASGGPGTAPLYALGASLVLLSALFLARRVISLRPQ